MDSIMVKNACEKHEKIVNLFFKNDEEMLKNMIDKILYKLGFDVDKSDFYSLGSEIFLDSLCRYDETQDFNGFLYSCLTNKFKTEMTRRNRIKRQADRNSISIDTPIGENEDSTIKDFLSSDVNVEQEIIKEQNCDENVELFLSSLSKIQRKIIELKMDEVEKDEIIERLSITDGEYNSAMKSIQMNENLSLFTKNINDCNYKEEAQMERIMEINEADNYRMDKRSMFSLLEDKKSGDINCKYILQRKPFQWTQEERNRYICRILSNLPIPEIILCEQNIKGLMIDHLIDGLQRLSYAEAFKENRFKVGANGAERHLIKYREFLIDENGQRILDEDGVPVYEEKICDVVGKHYKDLPNELKKRFNNFNVNVTKFFNCTDEQIADHIRDYNNHQSMNNEQLGMTKISADTARKIKAIAEKNTFFKNCGKFTDTTSVKGKLDKIVAESIMLLFHRDEWKSKIDKAYQFIDDNAIDEEFLGLNSDLNRLEIAIGEEDKETKKMFTVANTPMWLAVFHEFTTYNMEDSRFVDFLRAYNSELNQKEIDGVSMSDFKDKQSKKKATITGKIELLIKLMREYLHVNLSDLEEVDTLEFVKENVKSDATEDDVDLYSDMLDDLTLEVDNNTKLLDKHNRPSLIALVGYACENDIDLDDWIKQWFATNTIYILNQRDNFNEMVTNLQKGAVA